MKRIILLLLSLSSFNLMGQETNGELLKALNSALTIYGTNDISLFSLLENTGTLEQRQANIIQRIKLSSLGKIIVDKTAQGFTVNVLCSDSTPCFNIIKSDMTSAIKPAEAFFFSHAQGANLFAEKLGALSNYYATEKEKIVLKLWTDSKDLQTASKNIEPIKSAKNISLVANEDADEREDELEDKRQQKIATKMTSDGEMTEKKAREKKQLQLDRQNEKRKHKKNDELAEETETENNASNEQKDPRHDRPDRPDQLAEYEPLCKSLNAIFKSGRQSNFKDIEGSETNAEKKINESLLKLKGAKKNYLSWFKKQRAFMAEFKTSSDLELILIEFDKLQTDLENCLEGNWEDTDHSTDAIYANSPNEVKDVEYVYSEAQQHSSMRILINSANGKHTLFVRIQ